MSINRNLANFATSITSDGKAYITITVTVSGSKYVIDGTSQQTVSLSKGITYRFDVSDSSVSGHPFVFSTQSNGGGSSFTTGISTVGTAGSAGAYVQVTLEQDAPDHLGYYCSNHSNMGGLVKTAPIGDENFASFAGTFTFPTSDGSANQVLKTDGSGTLGFATVAASYANSDVDSHLNQSNPTSGYVLSWNGSDYAWVSNAGYTDANVNTHLNVSGASSGQILGWNGSDYAWVDDQSGSGGIASVLADTTPQLGGSLDVNGQAIVSASNGNIAITPNGSGKVILDGLSFPTADGSADQVLKTDGSGNLSFVAQATGGGSLNATADGSLANGDMVIVNADGTVSSIGTNSVSAATGTPVAFTTETIGEGKIVYDANSGKVVVAYRSQASGYYGKAVVGTISGNSISWGSIVTFSSSDTANIKITLDSTNNKVLIAYMNGSNNGAMIVGTISGTSISFGSEVIFKDGSGNIDQIGLTYDSSNQRAVVAYRDAGDSNKGKCNVGTVSGTSVSFGSDVTFSNSATYRCALEMDPTNNKVVLVWQDGGNSDSGTAAIGTVSGTSVSFGSSTVFHSGASRYFSMAYDTANQKMVIAYQDDADSDKGAAVVGTISGTGISFGSEVVFEDSQCTYIAATYDTKAQKILITYTDRYSTGGSYYLTSILGTVSGTAISFATKFVLDSGEGNYSSSAYDSSNGKIVVAYGSGSSAVGKGIVRQNAYSVTKSLTSENFIGVSDAAYSNGATATIQTAGSTDDAQSGLTAGESYYVQADGTLGTSPDTISVLAGTAVSATQLLINPDTNPASFGNTQVDAHLNVSGASSGQILSWNGSDYAWTADASGLNVVSSHSQTLSSNTTVAATDNAMSVGPVSIASGVTLTISSGARYAVI